MWFLLVVGVELNACGFEKFEFPSVESGSFRLDEMLEFEWVLWFDVVELVWNDMLLKCLRVPLLVECAVELNMVLLHVRALSLHAFSWLFCPL